MPASATPTRTDFIPIVLGGDIGSYALIREFHEAFGVKSIAMGPGFIGAIVHSKIAETHLIDAYTAGPLLAGLEAVHARFPEQRIVLVANTDPLIETLEEIHGDLPSYVSCTIPPRAAFDAVCDKGTFARLCREHGLEAPRTEVVRLAGTEPIAPSQIPFPVVAKPAVSAGYYDTLLKGFKKVYYITAQAELDELWRDLRASGFTGDFLVQELIGGDDTYMDSLTLYIGRDGKPRLLGAAQVLLEDHAPAMLGNPVAMVIREKPELWRRAAALLADAGYRGFANFDVKRDPATGREIFLDCNPRMGRNSYYNVAGGVNPMEVLVRDAIDEAEDDVRIAGAPALYTLVPLSLLRRYVRDEELLAEVNDLILRKRVFDPQRYEADRGLRRMIDVELTEKNQIRKFARYYPEATDTSF
ncbi:ATP-grasp domain-containing protein [[Collinsella] massiliensis]|uniref:ATP-grasp domain-containing protein n=1 Tax=[Collinsella] massiliensis TaxID=1232426 RepID=A0A1Y3Y2I5_9ACTN|nr:ATP-grasp domain-containing protein [[Collinsella] massiliensis]OUN88530.1 ATP-grasp domain-containing protein [[Collinsella] massiliensis]